MRRFWWVRHGPTHARTMVGWSDLPADLSDTARIARVTACLPREAPVISSDLSRAVATASAVQGRRPRLAHSPALREIHFGMWELRSFDEINAETPDLIHAFWKRPGDARAPGGESWHDLRARVDRAVNHLLVETEVPDLIVVAHFGTILTQVQRALHLTAREAFEYRIDNLSVTELRFDGSWHTGMINHCP